MGEFDRALADLEAGEFRCGFDASDQLAAPRLEVATGDDGQFGPNRECALGDAAHDEIGWARSVLLGYVGHHVELAARHGADELVILTITYDFAARKRSYELIAEAFGLQDRQAAA